MGNTKMLDIPGMTSGIVAVRDGKRGPVYTLQCARCLALEEPEHLVLMQTHFHNRSNVNNNPRLCRTCRIVTYPECDCFGCREDRTEEAREARSHV